MSNIIKITDLNIPELDVYARLSEVQLLRYNEPNLGLFICESPKVIMRALDAGYEPVSILVEETELKGEVVEIIKRCEELHSNPSTKSIKNTEITTLTSFKIAFNQI